MPKLLTAPSAPTYPPASALPDASEAKRPGPVVKPNVPVQDVDALEQSGLDRLKRTAARLGLPTPAAAAPAPCVGEVLGQAAGGRKTRIVSTIGPASNDVGTLTEMIRAGMDVARINFSHVRTYQDAKRTVDNLQAAMAAAGRDIKILADLQGPKIRVGELAEPIEVKVGQSFKLAKPGSGGDALEISPPKLIDDIEIGDPVFIDDGNIKLRVTGKDAQSLTVEVTEASNHPEKAGHGLIKSRKGLNIPLTQLSERIPTANDQVSIDIINRLNNEYPKPPISLVAVSFIEQADDMPRVLARFNPPVDGCAKIERPRALDNLEEIYAASRLVMVARGDLAVELGHAFVPAAQALMHRLGNQMQVITGTATEMLESMTQGGEPTRAEASDVFRSVQEGAEFVMTSGETAAGKDPAGVVRTMAKIIAASELPLGRVVDWNQEL